MNWRKCIDVDPRLMGGKPIIKGTRIAVGLVLEFLAIGATPQQVVTEYPHIQLRDVLACLSCGAELAHQARALPREEEAL
jgi:uncharacterized protein (DUF433 family)